MNFKSQANQMESISFLLTPILNLFFLILAFFSSVMILSEEEKVVGINLGSISTAQDDIRSGSEIVININNEGQISLGERVISPESFASKLSQLALFANNANVTPSVIIRADARTQHRHILQIIDICKRSGIKQIDIATLSAVN